jgi:hypothetical protein
MTRIAIVLLALAASLCAADVSGKWTASVPMRDGPVAIVIDLKCQGETVTGTVSSDEGSTDLIDGKLAGNDLTFALATDSDRYQVKGKVNGGEIRFSAQREGADRTIEFTAKKTE